MIPSPKDVQDRLAEYYGHPVVRPHRQPVEELILTVLSQHTSDRHRDRSYLQLRRAFPTWELVEHAPVELVEETIRFGGLARTKAPRIQAILSQISTPYDLSWMQQAPIEESRAYLMALPGVGRKTAACVLLFSYGLPDIPVDTHVGRVTERLGWMERKSDVYRHNRMLELFDNAWEAHVNLLRHGRRICTAPGPKCGQCPLRDICPSSQVRISSTEHYPHESSARQPLPAKQRG